MLLLNEIWQWQSKLTNFFHPQQKLVSKVRDGAKVTKKYDKAATPFHRVINHPDTPVDLIAALAVAHGRINPAAVQRRIQTLTNQLFTLTTSKSGACVNKRALSHEATKGLNRPGMSGDSVAWEGWGHVSEFVEEVSAGAA